MITLLQVSNELVFHLPELGASKMCSNSAKLVPKRSCVFLWFLLLMIMVEVVEIHDPKLIVIGFHDR